MIDFEKYRELFPVTENLIYFDHAAVAPLHKKSREVLEEYTNYFLNYGIKNYDYWYQKVENIRKNFAAFIGANASEIAFIKNTSAGISILANGLKYKKGDNIIVPNIEFPANIYPWMSLSRQGVNVKFLECDNGTINLEKLDDLIDSKTRVVSLSWVEFSNGFKNDLKSISEICRKKSQEYGRKIIFCVDGIQGLGAYSINVKELGIDFFVADGHKWFLAAEGAGFLYCSEEIIDQIYPISIGWKSVVDPLNFSNIHFELQKNALKFEEGSINMPGILTLGASLELFNEIGIQNIENRVLKLADYFRGLLSEKNITFTQFEEDTHKSAIVSFLDREPKKCLEKLLSNNIQLSLRGEFLRVSPHFYNTEKELEILVDLL